MLATFHSDSKTLDPCLEQAMSVKHFWQKEEKVSVWFFQQSLGFDIIYIIKIYYILKEIYTSYKNIP